MKEEEFDSLMMSRSFGTEDATRADAQLRRMFTVGTALWGRTPEDLKRQLLAPHPEIPSAAGRSGSGDPEAIEQQRLIILLLLQNGASTQRKDGSGKTVKQAASSDWIRELLQTGA